MKKNRILAIDNEPDVLAFLRLVLHRSGYEVLTAATGLEGLIQAILHQPDLILLDATVEEKDGWKTQERLHRDDRTRHIPIVILSTCSTPQDRRRALDAGAVDYLPKPFTLRDGLDRIQAILRPPAAATAASVGLFDVS